MNATPMKNPNPRAPASAPPLPAGWVADYPMSSALIVFGIGLGAGVALGSLLDGLGTSRPTLGRRAEQTAEQIGRQMRDALTGVVPRSWAKHNAA